MWAIARYDLRLSDEGFLALTPGQFNALMERAKEHDKREDLRVGVALSWLTAPHLKEALGPETFFSSLKPEPKMQTPEEMQAVLDSLMRRQRNG